MMRPLFMALDATGMLTALQKRMNRQSNINDIYKPAFGSYQPDENDVLVCTYTKSGTNWMLQIIYQIVHQGAGSFHHIYDVVPWPDSLPLVTIPLEDKVPSPTGKRVIKTHLAEAAVPYSQEARYIYIIRDPKDVFVSSYHFAKDVALGPLMPSVKSWLETFLSPDFMFNDWAEHVAGYWQQRHRDNLLILTFEEMKADHAGCVCKVADFIGVSLSDGVFESVLEQSSFRYMQNIDHKFYPGPVLPTAPATGRVMRRGQSGTSGDLLSPQQQHRIDTYFKNRLQELNCDLPYDERFKPA